jgi:hypothetical protein
MQQALIRAKELIPIAYRHVHFLSTNLSTQPNVWATAVTLDSKSKAC